MTVKEALRVIFWPPKPIADVDFAGILGLTIGGAIGATLFSNSILAMAGIAFLSMYPGRAVGVLAHGRLAGRVLQTGHRYFFKHLASIALVLLLALIGLAAAEGRFVLLGLSGVFVAIATGAASKGKRGATLAGLLVVDLLFLLLGAITFVLTMRVAYLAAVGMCAFTAMVIIREWRRSQFHSGRSSGESAFPASPA